MKAREERQKVVIKARMRTAASWHDVCIINLSSRGVGIQAADPPPRGSYVEICRGRHVIVARVAWTRGHRAGLSAQDPIWVQALINEPTSARHGTPANVPGQPVERRRVPRSPRQRHGDSRIRARAFEFACFVMVGGAMGVGAFGMVEEALARPLSQIRAALG